MMCMMGIGHIGIIVCVLLTLRPGYASSVPILCKASSPPLQPKILYQANLYLLLPDAYSFYALHTSHTDSHMTGVHTLPIPYA